ncbi:MAG: flavin reductase [Bacteroidetes bacterium]|nr:flavin reductase [Bacteroidota bacterium]
MHLKSKILTTTDFEQMDNLFKKTFFNSLSGFKSVNLIGTLDKFGNTNLSIFSSIFHVGANPPLIGFIVRPDSVDRHTLQNILETEVYTINNIKQDFYIKAHQTSARYPKEFSEFKECGFTEFYSNSIKAPYVLESNINIGLQKKEIIKLELNGTIIVIGEVKEVLLPEDLVEGDGFVNHEKAESITCCGLDSYHTTNILSRLAYAKPNKLTQKLK